MLSKLVASMKILNSRQHPQQKGIVLEKSYGSIPHLMSAEKLYDSLTSTFQDFINTASYSIETILRSATVVCQIWQV